MAYGVLVATHLFCATVFIGTVTFELLILEGIRPYLPAQYMSLVEEGIHRRARKIMPWVVGLLFMSGLTMAATVHRHVLLDALSMPFTFSSGTLLALKILLAVSVLTHFVLAMKHSICGSMTSKRFKYTHLSVFLHMIMIVLLAVSFRFL